MTTDQTQPKADNAPAEESEPSQAETDVVLDNLKDGCTIDPDSYPVRVYPDSELINALNLREVQKRESFWRAEEKAETLLDACLADFEIIPSFLEAINAYGEKRDSLHEKRVNGRREFLRSHPDLIGSCVIASAIIYAADKLAEAHNT